jgi:hypothetical protein
MKVIYEIMESSVWLPISYKYVDSALVFSDSQENFIFPSQSQPPPPGRSRHLDVEL